MKRMIIIVIGVSLLVLLIIIFRPFNWENLSNKNFSKQDSKLKSVTAVEKDALPEYKIVDEKVYDSPVKTQIEQHIVVYNRITEKNLKALLRYQHNAISQRTGFEYHKKPTNIYIYVYESDEKAKVGQGLWLAMSEMNILKYGDSKPRVTIRTEQINNLGEKPQEKFGLTESERKEIFQELVRIEKKATEESMKRFPSDINKQIDLERKLQERYREELAEKYSLNRDQLQSIMAEGVRKRWRY